MNTNELQTTASCTAPAQDQPAGPVADNHTPPMEPPPAPIQPFDPDRLVTGPRLLEILFEPESRPSMQWLRKQVHQRSIPYVRRGGKWWFRPRHVDEWFRQREQFPKNYGRAASG